MRFVYSFFFCNVRINGIYVYVKALFFPSVIVVDVIFGRLYLHVALERAEQYYVNVSNSCFRVSFLSEPRHQFFIIKLSLN